MPRAAEDEAYEKEPARFGEVARAAENEADEISDLQSEVYRCEEHLKTLRKRLAEAQQGARLKHPSHSTPIGGPARHGKAGVVPLTPKAGTGTGSSSSRGVQIPIGMSAERAEKFCPWGWPEVLSRAGSRSGQ